MARSSPLQAMVAAVTLAMAMSSAQAASFDCGVPLCGLPAESPYRNLVVGTIDGQATAEQTGALFQAGRGAGLWRDLPDDPAGFAAAVQPVSIRIDGSQALTVLMGRLDARANALQPGDTVRFSPHPGDLHRPARASAPELAYWAAVGCIMVLCRAGDAPCESRYRPGLYRYADGAALDGSGQPLPDAPSVDTMTMLPKSAL